MKVKWEYYSQYIYIYVYIYIWTNKTCSKPPTRLIVTQLAFFAGISLMVLLFEWWWSANQFTNRAKQRRHPSTPWQKWLSLAKSLAFSAHAAQFATVAEYLGKPERCSLGGCASQHKRRKSMAISGNYRKWRYLTYLNFKGYPQNFYGLC